MLDIALKVELAFSRSVGEGKATTRKIRGLTRSVMALMVPPSRRRPGLQRQCTLSVPCALPSAAVSPAQRGVCAALSRTLCCRAARFCRRVDRITAFLVAHRHAPCCRGIPLKCNPPPARRWKIIRRVFPPMTSSPTRCPHDSSRVLPSGSAKKAK